MPSARTPTRRTRVRGKNFSHELLAILHDQPNTAMPVYQLAKQVKRTPKQVAASLANMCRTHPEYGIRAVGRGVYQYVTPLSLGESKHTHPLPDKGALKADVIRSLGDGKFLLDLGGAILLAKVITTD